MKKMKTILVSILSSLLCLTPFKKCTDERQDSTQLTRKVEYKDGLFDENILKEAFDEYDLKKEENGDVLLNATKDFDSSILDDVDFVGLDESKNTFSTKYVISYDESEEEVFLTAKIIAENDIEIVDNIPGLICNNKAFEPDILFMINEEEVWLSDLTSDSNISETGWFSSLFRNIKASVSTCMRNILPIIMNLVKVVLRTTSKTCWNLTYVLIGRHNAASGGAYVLNMDEDIIVEKYSDGSQKNKHTGIYHARFDCWQQYFGYCNFYDVVFDLFTNMRKDRFEFSIDNQDYIFWLWKGDYLNLGAGCELGVYKRWEYNDKFWKVDKNLALPMTLNLKYNGREIIDYKPDSKQWWITGFNSNYDDVNVDKLTASFSVKFVTKGYSSKFDKKFYDEFLDMERQNLYQNNKWKKWKINESLREATYSF